MRVTIWASSLEHTVSSRREGDSDLRAPREAGRQLELLDVPSRRIAEQPAILATELRRTLVPDLIRCARRVHRPCQHQPPSFLEPELLLVLQRTHRGYRLEVRVERRRA